jgi:putative phosphoesterase
MKIAILSDSHHKDDLTLEAISYLKTKGAKYLIHAGDLIMEENLKILQKSNLPYIAVFGNNDYNLVQYQDRYNIKKEPYYFKIENFTFKLMHMPYYLNSDTNIIIFGHTHKFETYYKNNTLFINPGEICARNKPLTQCVLLTITQQQYIVEYYFKKPYTKDWQTKQFLYNRQTNEQ